METPPMTSPTTDHDAQPPFDSSAKSDVILRSSDNVDFYVLKMLLSFSSPYFESMCSQPMLHTRKQHLPAIKLTEDSKTLQAFLPFFYPGVAPRVVDLDDIINVMAAGHKYGVDAVVKQMSQELLDLPIMTEDPFRMFALAFHHGWETVGLVAAKNTLAISVSEVKFSSELAYISGMEVYKLLQYRLQCISAIRKNTEQTRRLLTDLVMPSFKELVASRAQALTHRDWGDWYSPSIQIHQCSLSGERLGTSMISTPGHVMVDGLSISNYFSNPSGVQWWWVIYIRDLLKEVEARPRGSTVLDNRLSDKAIEEAMNCSTCNKHVHREMPNFKRLFAEEIEEVISGVLLDVDFSSSKSLQMGEGK